jgi:leader peptidase (prepilin peptidase)/N-methyltransferase
VNYSVAFFTRSEGGQSLLGLIITASIVWTACLWGYSRWLTRGVYPVCHPAISFLISIFSVASLFSLFVSNSPFFVSYLFFFSALIITIFTDARTLLISRMVTLYAMPIGWLLSNLQLLPITPLESIGGSLTGLLILLFVRVISKKLLGKEGLGQGDVDLLCFIGAFTGPKGCWITLMTGSLLGSLLGVLYFIIAKGRRDILLPFGLFLGMGAILYVLFQEKLTAFFLPPW